MVNSSMHVAVIVIVVVMENTKNFERNNKSRKWLKLINHYLNVSTGKVEKYHSDIL